MAGKAYITKTDVGTSMIYLVTEGKIVDRMEVEEVIYTTDSEIEKEIEKHG